MAKELRCRWCVQVHWEFWSNANDMCGPVCDVQKSFMKVRRQCSAALSDCVFGGSTGTRQCTVASKQSLPRSQLWDCKSRC